MCGEEEEEEEEEEEDEDEEDDTSKRIKSAYPSVGAIDDKREPAAVTRAPLCRLCVNTGAGGGGLGVLVAAAAAAAALAVPRAVGVGGHSPDSPM